MNLTAITAPGISFGVAKRYIRGEEIQYEDQKIILITDEDLMSSDTMKFEWDKISGILTTKGTKNSHSAIVARQHEVSAGIVDDINEIQEGDFIALDTYSSLEGCIYYFPNKEEISKLLQELEVLRAEKEILSQYKNEKTITKDGKKVMIASNIGSKDEVPLVKNNFAEGIGVVRTEFSYEMYDETEGRLPNEEELYREYYEISKGLQDKPIVIRTLDAGADKPVNSLKKVGILKDNEINPALGSRGVRPCIQNPEILKTQLKAILRANAKYGNLQIMFPMITSIEEIEKAKEILEESIEELEKKEIAFKKAKVGIMVETPAIAQITDKLSKYIDFISIGTNDLTQYMTAADRMNSSVEKIANPYNPGMIRILNNIISGAHKGEKYIPCCVCGELGGELEYIPILLGMGLDEFSMNSVGILSARRLISNINSKDCEKLLYEILEKDKCSEIEEKSKEFYRRNNLRILSEERLNRKNKLVTVCEKVLDAKELRDKYYELNKEQLPEYVLGDIDDGR